MNQIDYNRYKGYYELANSHIDEVDKYKRRCYVEMCICECIGDKNIWNNRYIAAKEKYDGLQEIIEELHILLHEIDSMWGYAQNDTVTQRESKIYV